MRSTSIYVLGGPLTGGSPLWAGRPGLGMHSRPRLARRPFHITPGPTAVLTFHTLHSLIFIVSCVYISVSPRHTHRAQ